MLDGFDWTNVVAAGGYVVNTLHKEKSPLSFDVDLWLLGDASTQRSKVQQIVGFFHKRCAQRQVALYSAVQGSVLSLWIEDSEVMIQVICNTDHKTGKDVVSRFDFGYCQVYYNGTDVFGTMLAVEALNSRITRVNPNKTKPLSQARYQKALKKGFLVALPKDAQFEKSKTSTDSAAVGVLSTEPHYFPQSTVSNAANIAALKARYRVKEVLVNEGSLGKIVPIIKAWGTDFEYKGLH